jgi:hypothetical protein
MRSWRFLFVQRAVRRIVEIDRSWMAKDHVPEMPVPIDKAKALAYLLVSIASDLGGNGLVRDEPRVLPVFDWGGGEP